MKNTPNSALRSLRSHKKRILLITIATIATLAISSLVFLWLSKVLNFTGTIRTTGVEGYWDKDLTNKTGLYHWGTIWPGTSRNVTVYLRSISNVEIMLNLTTGNWTFWNSGNEIIAGPSNSTSYMYLTWDYDNSTLQLGEIIKVTLTLHARSSSDFIDFLIAKDVKAFSFDIYISTSPPS